MNKYVIINKVKLVLVPVSLIDEMFREANSSCSEETLNKRKAIATKWIRRTRLQQVLDINDNKTLDEQFIPIRPEEFRWLRSLCESPI
jgi:hypothetical protein